MNKGTKELKKILNSIENMSPEQFMEFYNAIELNQQKNKYIILSDNTDIHISFQINQTSLKINFNNQNTQESNIHIDKKQKINWINPEAA